MTDEEIRRWIADLAIEFPDATSIVVNHSIHWEPSERKHSLSGSPSGSFFSRPYEAWIVRGDRTVEIRRKPA